MRAFFLCCGWPRGGSLTRDLARMREVRDGERWASSVLVWLLARDLGLMAVGPMHKSRGDDPTGLIHGCLCKRT